MTTLSDAGTASTLTATNGWNGKTKCTWQVRSPTATMGPVFKLKSTSTSDMYINWMEWSDVTGLGTNAVLGTVDGASYYIGAYAVPANQVWLSPLTGLTLISDTTLSPSTFATYFKLNDPSTVTPGTIGRIEYYPAAAGDYQETQVAYMDQFILASQYDSLQSTYNTFNSAKATYDDLRSTFDVAYTVEIERLKDFGTSIFVAPISVPARPCGPSQPAAWTGIELKLG